MNKILRKKGFKTRIIGKKDRRKKAKQAHAAQVQ